MTGTTPAVSVLVKAYNHAPFVRRSIDSILTQSFQDFEIIVTDDASTDGTPDILRGFADPRIHFLALPRNLGISGAMNATVARARGQYLAILNSDDWALPDRLRCQVDFLDLHPDISLVFGQPLPVDEADQPTEAHGDFGQALRLPDFSRRSWLRHFFFGGNCLCAPAAMIRREAYAAAGEYDRRLTNLQDLDMWIRMLIAGHAFHATPEPVTALRIRAGNANMSAPRMDTWLRTKFETAKILRHYAAFDLALFQEVFGDPNDAAAAPTGSPARLVAELALRDPRQEYQSFGLDAIYQNASDDDDFDRLRILTGEADPLGARAIMQLGRSLDDCARTIEALNQAAAEQNGGARC